MKRRYLNIALFLLGLFALYFSIRVLNQKNVPGEISITQHAKFLFGYFALFFGCFRNCIGVLLLIFKPKALPSIN